MLSLFDAVTAKHFHSIPLPRHSRYSTVLVLSTWYRMRMSSISHLRPQHMLWS